ncbi:hypothetical protein [Nonomuraea sp. SYSU D8015]|uniref:hypothetical protein n=1 Tax=Nonomuraea sp. SYSU D8015 TaxID=2593644 RepID=UPI0016608A3E|nr:hypothetical protein [Nonomuraea sp. SYSU D8015]
MELPFRQEVKVDHGGIHYLMLDASSPNAPRGTLTCRITVNGEVMAENEGPDDPMRGCLAEADFP